VSDWDFRQYPEDIMGLIVHKQLALNKSEEFEPDLVNGVPIADWLIPVDPLINLGLFL